MRIDNEYNKNKTVYVLGAGFSRVVSAPSQNEILTEINNIKDSDFNHVLSDYKEEFFKSKKKLFKFLCKMFACSVDSACQIELEDVFTLLDKAISKQQYIGAYSVTNLKEFKRCLSYCITLMFELKLFEPDMTFYEKLSKVIINKRIEKNNIKFDNLSFINLNWDLLLDNSIYRSTNDKKYKGKELSIDYCFYTDTYKDDNKHIPHIKLKTKGIYNIKVLKPHGSFNWLCCVNCAKVFISFQFLNKLAKFDNYSGKGNSKKLICPYCGKNALKSVIKTPTLIKEFDNVHLGDVLHNTQIELMEAKRVVFVGYSLPLADIELRYIFKRCIRNQKNIVEIVLYKTDNANDEEIREYNETIKRYNKFFGNMIKTTGFEDKGTKAFFEHEFGFKT